MTSSKSLLLVTLLSLLVHFSTAEYNQTDALEYAYTAAIAYCQPESIESWTCGVPCDHLPGYQYFFAEKMNVTSQQTLSLAMIYNPTTKRFITSFRGTAGAYELLLEILEGAAVPYTLYNITGAIADDYFYTHYVNNMRSLVTTQLQKARESFPDFTYVFTGHSLGAALTTLAAFDVVSSGLIPREQAVIYHYGSPRVANQILADAIEAAIPEIYRLVHWKDTVPHLPPCSDVSGHCTPTLEEGDDAGVVWPAWHVAQQVFYNQDNTNYTLCGGEDPDCMDKFLLPETDVLDHFHYLNIHMECDKTSVIPLDTLGKREVIKMESEVRSVGKEEIFEDFILENKMFTYDFQV